MNIWIGYTNQQKKDVEVKKQLRKDILIHIPAAMVGCLLALLLVNVRSNKKFERRQNAAVYATDDHSRAAELNRDIFSPNTFESIEWRYQTNQRAAEIFGRTTAKEYAMSIDSLRSGIVTAPEMFDDVSDFCSEAVVNAYRNAGAKLRVRGNNAKAVPFPTERCADSKDFQKAMQNAKHLVKYFETDSVPNSIVKKPTEQDMCGISAGSIICKGRHCYMYMGVGYIDKMGRTFVADSRGRPVVAASDKKALFGYFDWSKCTVIDVPKIIEHKLQNDVQRHVR